ncbi:hypothetical protein [Bacteroides sp.]|uniref:hypothetical protein n=1 Tax=Bacteroides sp. TaxID=29523 RepID=UPI0025BD0537|nr:hypothetical protein [Bacteroides sp.]
MSKEMEDGRRNSGDYAVNKLVTGNLSDSSSYLLSIFAEWHNTEGGDFKGRSDDTYKQICETDPDFVYLTEYVGICSPKLDNMLKSK